MALFEIKDLKNDTARKNYTRQRLAEILKTALENEFGAENVVYVPKAIYPNDGGKIDSESIAVRVADIEDKDGYIVDYVAVISPQMKPHNTVVRKDGKTTLALNLDDIRDAVETIEGARRD